MAAHRAGHRWPQPASVGELGGAFETLVDEDDELVLDGIDARNGARVVISMRDLGEDVSAGFWDQELARLSRVMHPSAAPVVAVEIVDDRFFVITTNVPHQAVSLQRRLEEHGPVEGLEAVAIAMATLEVAVELHALGLSAAGMRLRSTMELETSAGLPTIVVTTYGLHVDNDVEVFEDLREIALRVLGVVGGRHERGALIVPEGALLPEVERLFRRAVGLEAPPLRSAREMLDELSRHSGQPQRRRRPTERVAASPRPLGQAASVFGSELLLAEEFLAAESFDETPPPLPRTTRR